MSTVYLTRDDYRAGAITAWMRRPKYYRQSKMWGGRENDVSLDLEEIAAIIPRELWPTREDQCVRVEIRATRVKECK